jgi:6-methylsalicylate decarboxylase
MTDGLVDFHAHYVTDDYIAAAKQFGHEVPDNMPAWPTWSAAEHLRLMDDTGIGRALLSISSPGIHFGEPDAARVLAREVNEFAARTVQAHPDRFGYFASLPLPDVDHALTEVARVMRDGTAAGFSLMSNSGGVYLGDARYEPLWADLDRRGATVFVHPTKPPIADAVALGRPLPLIEFVFDTARTVVDLMFAGVFLRHPGIRFVFSHSGGVLPVLMERVELFRGRSMGIGDGDPAESARIQLGGLWFDCAGTPFPTALPTLASVVGTERLLFGSDYCFTRPHMVAQMIQTIGEADMPSAEASWLDLFARNAKELL